MALEDEGEFVLRERRISVREADAAVELRVSGHAPLDTGHADQDQAGIAAVELVAEIFERGRGKALGFVNYDKFEAADRRRVAARPAEALFDARAHAVDQERYVLAHRGHRAGDDRGVEECARPRQSGIDFFVGGRARSPVGQQGLRKVPVRVTSRGQRFSDPCGTMTKADRGVAAHGISELDEAPVLTRRDKAAGATCRHGLRSSS